MAIPHYGVWVGKPTRYRAETARQDSRSPHIYLHFTDGSHMDKEYEAAINVKSTNRDTRLVFWLDRDLHNPVARHLEQLDPGLHPIKSHNHDHHTGSVPGIDYLRTPGLVDVEAGRLLPHDIPGPMNDVLDLMEPILNDAIRHRATMYIFGQPYNDGIHDIHLNQGNLPQFENGVFEDGGLFFRFPDGHWEGVFLAFASQRVPTDDTGKPAHYSTTLAQMLGYDQ
ncbi:hypothetical protein BDV37DRAFT_242414 [Aspergillus pseudonomiae]|uniref:DUF2278 family protein n=1 Tax=Aspergillus pseudonomiae TaxID=1506151 RepID=A0A5N7DMI9_9EURO|nr:uncharacterized protein BDV37DRAFT_242414 [Aspergillus pseudonomiae]KAE8406698.1 hypothetical protein BDV37DRAFT_242414 [Aspergillus pseudonomiae]